MPSSRRHPFSPLARAFMASTVLVFSLLSEEMVEIDTDLQEHAQASGELLGRSGMLLYGDG